MKNRPVNKTKSSDGNESKSECCKHIISQGEPVNKNNMMGKTYNADYPTAGIDTSVTIKTTPDEPVNKQLDTDRERIRECLAINGLPHDEIEGNMILALIASEKIKELEQLASQEMAFNGNDKGAFAVPTRYIKHRINELRSEQ